MSNHDLIKWCRYLDIPINDVLSRDEKVPHNHKQALFIYNLEPSYMSGSHWVATYVKDNVINYFGKGKESDPTVASANTSANALVDSWPTVS